MVVQYCTHLQWSYINHGPYESLHAYINFKVSMPLIGSCMNILNKTFRTTLPKGNVILDVLVKISNHLLSFEIWLMEPLLLLPSLRLFIWFWMYWEFKKENSSNNNLNSSPCNLVCNPSPCLIILDARNTLLSNMAMAKWVKMGVLSCTLAY